MVSLYKRTYWLLCFSKFLLFLLPLCSLQMGDQTTVLVGLRVEVFTQMASKYSATLSLQWLYYKCYPSLKMVEIEQILPCVWVLNSLAYAGILNFFVAIFKFGKFETEFEKLSSEHISGICRGKIPDSKFCLNR